MADQRRMRRVSMQIQRYVASIIDEELAFPNLVSVVAVNCDSSFTKAFVHVGIYGDQATEEYTLEQLREQAWFVRRELSRRTKMRRTPEIVFIADTSARDGQATIDMIDALDLPDNPSQPDVE